MITDRRVLSSKLMLEDLFAGTTDDNVGEDAGTAEHDAGSAYDNACVMTVPEANIEVEIGAYSNTENVSDDDIVTATVSVPPSPSLNLSISRPERTNEDWKINKKFHKVPVFTSKFCPKMSYSHKSQPFDYFTNLFPDSIIDLIVQETNRYATQKNSKNFQPTTAAEIKAFFGVMIMMGLHPLPDFELYWSTDPFYHNKEIQAL
ncbi:unnamed protein product [Euphydryas editha]|uniref:PiggyBac transposable element-derived protein domain-containing protein n=1 Tax=Euphydryas editha TaxID=104508 RepID=A0AAU9U036_EUPED|nr:unnamed protein product [Euphydryas editha]